MAKKRKKRKGGDETASPHLAEHIRLLDLESVADYRTWCRERGLSARIDKTPIALQNEIEELRVRAARDIAEKRKRIRDPLDAMRSALDGTLDLELVQQRELRAVCKALAGLDPKRPHRDRLVELMTVVSERGKFLLDREAVGGERLPYWRGLVTLNERRGQWRRDLDAWRPRSHNRRKQFASLARHLLADYYVPGFLDAAWLRRDAQTSRYRDLFIHVGRGGNPRTAKTPVPMTKKVSHWFLQAPEHFTIEGAIRWGQVHALGGGARLSEALAATPLGRGFENEDFWRTVIAFFVQNPMLDPVQIGPLIDFIEHVKFRSTEVVGPDGSVEVHPPPQPGFSMAKRTPAALMRQMDRWHTGLGRRRNVGPPSWAGSGIGEFRWETGDRIKRCWRIRELRSRTALQLEGRAMRHCVVSYATSCASGQCSIWSLDLETPDGREKRVTIEVSRQRVVVQTRGKDNRLPTDQEMDTLRRWAEQEELEIGTYL
ncbi:MAG: PcfJ domain-containing protein [Planctomycetota bacterium]